MAKAKHLTPEEVGRKLGFRSGLEKVVAAQLSAFGIAPNYEQLKLKYRVEKNHTYTPDFPVTKGIVIETKGRFLTSDRMKMLLIKEQYPDIDFRFVFTNSKSRISKISKTTYGEWCDRNGFKYADKVVPLAWIEEIKNINKGN